MRCIKSQSKAMYIFVIASAFACCALAQNAIINHRNVLESDPNTSSSPNDMEQCQAVCVDIFFLLPDDPQAMPACQRGCRIFNIVYLRDDRNLNNSKDECYTSCGDAYAELDLNSACRKGCKNMLRKKQSELEAVIVYIEQDVKNIDSPQPELEELEMNWFIENYAPRELHYVDGQNQKDYKIPESMYRTLPIETLIEELAKPVNPRPSGDWLDCASRNSGIPKWILVTAIISAILVALYLSISSEKKVTDDILLVDDDEESGDREMDAGPLPVKVPLSDDKDDRLIDVEIANTEETEEKDDVALLIGVAHFDDSQQRQEPRGDDVTFSAPPKYSVEKEIV